MLILLGMFNCPLNLSRTILFWRCLFATVFTSSLFISYFGSPAAQAQVTEYCQLTTAAAKAKEDLRLSALQSNPEAQKRYQQLLKQHAEDLQNCRNQTWPETQAIWLRLYPCDIQPGAIDQIMDRIVNRGYNQVYVEAFSDGQVLLPAGSNPTVWPSVVRTAGAENIDLLSVAIEKGRQRGLKV